MTGWGGDVATIRSRRSKRIVRTASVYKNRANIGKWVRNRRAPRGAIGLVPGGCKASSSFDSARRVPADKGRHMVDTATESAPSSAPIDEDLVEIAEVEANDRRRFCFSLSIGAAI